MNATLYIDTDVALDVYEIPMVVENQYATTPILAMLPRYQPVTDEVLHASFEDALGDRIVALHEHWSLHSNGGLHSVIHNTDPLLGGSDTSHTEPTVNASNHMVMRLAPQNWRRKLIFVCLPLMLLMAGFDLMGLLVLSMHS